MASLQPYFKRKFDKIFAVSSWHKKWYKLDRKYFEKNDKPTALLFNDNLVNAIEVHLGTNIGTHLV